MKQNWSLSLLVLVFCACGGSPPEVVAPEETDRGQASSSAQATAEQGSGSAAGLLTQPEGPEEQAASFAQTPVSGTSLPQSAASPQPAAAVALPRGSKVLHVGDSFAGALGLPLGALLEEAGVKSVLKHTDASYLTDWAWNGELQKLLWKYNPDLLVITLGANELAITEPSQRVKTIQKLMSLVGDRPCLWVAIPLWEGKHNGLMDIIKENISPCIYWDTNQLIDVVNMPRISDGIHPTTEARADWAQVVFDWLVAHRQVGAERPWALAQKK